MANSKAVILTKVTYFPKDSFITINTNKSNKFVSVDSYKTSSLEKWENGEIKYLSDVEFLGESKSKQYFRAVNPIWMITFLEEVCNNKRIDNSEYCDPIESLMESISEYSGDCKIHKLIKDIETSFDKGYSDKKGKESKKFITLYNEYSYYDSYAGDGDYSIEYEKVVDLKY